MSLPPATATHNLPEHRLGCSWAYELDFACRNRHPKRSIPCYITLNPT